MCVLALGFVVVGCGTSREHDDGETDARASEGVFEPFVGAIDCAHGVQHAADERNETLDAALSDD
jgi:hypothetical protein